MTTKDNLKNLVRRGVRRIANKAQARDVERGYRDVDLALSAMLGPDTLSEILFPVSYVEFLRHWMEPSAHEVTVVKAETSLCRYTGEAI